MDRLIHYDGFTVSANSRTYNFHLTDPQGKPRRFTVSIPLEAFRSTQFKLQDGPDICFGRLKRELEGETEALHAASHLSIVPKDIQDYADRHHPRKT